MEALNITISLIIILAIVIIVRILREIKYQDKLVISKRTQNIIYIVCIILGLYLTYRLYNLFIM